MCERCMCVPCVKYPCGIRGQAERLEVRDPRRAEVLAQRRREAEEELGLRRDQVRPGDAGRDARACSAARHPRSLGGRSSSRGRRGRRTASSRPPRSRPGCRSAAAPRRRSARARCRSGSLEKRTASRSAGDCARTSTGCRRSHCGGHVAPEVRQPPGHRDARARPASPGSATPARRARPRAAPRAAPRSSVATFAVTTAWCRGGTSTSTPLSVTTWTPSSRCCSGGSDDGAGGRVGRTRVPVDERVDPGRAGDRAGAAGERLASRQAHQAAGGRARGRSACASGWRRPSRT